MALRLHRPPRLVVMLSGSGRTLVNLLDHIERGDLHAEIPLVIASRDCLGAERARERGVQVRVMKGEIPSGTLADVLEEVGADLVVLAGYLRMVRVPAAYEGRVVNIHPALLPDFGGPGMHGMRVHEAVLASGRRESGCTVHICDDQYDHGPIVWQERVPVHPEDTPETLAARVFEAECRAYPRAIAMLLEQMSEEE